MRIQVLFDNILTLQQRVVAKTKNKIAYQRIELIIPSGYKIKLCAQLTYWTYIQRYQQASTLLWLAKCGSGKYEVAGYNFHNTEHRHLALIEAI